MWGGVWSCVRIHGEEYIVGIPGPAVDVCDLLVHLPLAIAVFLCGRHHVALIVRAHACVP
jgi:hypothetical protein